MRSCSASGSKSKLLNGSQARRANQTRPTVFARPMQGISRFVHHPRRREIDISPTKETRGRIEFGIAAAFEEAFRLHGIAVSHPELGASPGLAEGRPRSSCKLVPLHTNLFIESNPAPTKYALSLPGANATPNAPFLDGTCDPLTGHCKATRWLDGPGRQPTLRATVVAMYVPKLMSTGSASARPTPSVKRMSERLSSFRSAIFNANSDSVWPLLGDASCGGSANIKNAGSSKMRSALLISDSSRVGEI